MKISVRLIHHNAKISIRWTVRLGTEPFPGSTFIKESLNVKIHKVDAP